jgi:hypothetical protein
LHRIADAGYIRRFEFAPRCAELRRFALRIPKTVEDDRERAFPDLSHAWDRSASDALRSEN